MRRRHPEDEYRSDEPGPDHFEPYRAYDPNKPDDEDDEEIEDAKGIIAGPDENDADLLSDPNEEVTVECPKCGYEIWGEAEQCPLCSEWLTSRQRRRNPSGLGAWAQGSVVFIILLLILAMLLWR